MIKKDIAKIFVNYIYSKAPKKNMKIIKKIYNKNDEIWSLDLADMIDHKVSNNQGDSYTFKVIDSFSKRLWAIRLEKKIAKK